MKFKMTCSKCVHLAVLIVSMLVCHSSSSTNTIDKYILNAAPKAEMFNMYHVMPDAKVKIMTELDMLLSMDQYKQLYDNEGKTRTKRKVALDRDLRWTGCIVYYEIAEVLDTTKVRNVIKEAMDHWEKLTCLIFREDPKRRQKSRIVFEDGGGCYSEVGMQDEPQKLVLARGCRNKGVVAHEIGHAIGWYHEHMRPDRDNYITVNYDSIPLKYQSNFKKYNYDVIDTYDVAYDYSSMMHYGNGAFPNGIITHDKKYQDIIGQRIGMSFKDIKTANVMYGCARMACPVKDCGEGFQLSKFYKGMPKCTCWCDSGDLKDPLVACSSLPVTPTPPVIPLTPPPVLPEAECIDIRDDCSKRKAQNHCMTDMVLMESLCKRTCGMCGEHAKMCMDLEDSCPLLAAAGSCHIPGLSESMKKLCPMSCKVCKNPTDPCTIQKEMMKSSLKSVPHSGDDEGINTGSRSSVSRTMCVLSIILFLFLKN